MNKEKLQYKIQRKEEVLNELKEQLQELENQERLELEKNKDKPIYTKIPELGIEISQQMFNGKTYAEILKLVNEEQIATYDILFKLRSLTEKYPQFKEFWVFVPNPDKISKDNNCVAGFFANSVGAVLDCDWVASGTGPALGVFLVRKLRSKK